MSNGDDVLDNWEEIDETGLKTSIQKLRISPASSCEGITRNSYVDTNLTTSGIVTVSSTTTTSSSRPTQMKVLQRSNAQDSATSSSTSKPLNNSALDNTSSSFQPVMMVLHKPQDEYQSANYTAPIANQTVKILRRPTQSNENRNNFIRPKQPIKTLQQREQEYAEARLRILGSAKNPEDEEQRIETPTPSTVVTNINNSVASTPLATSTAALSNNSFTNMAATTKLNSSKTQVCANQYNQQLQQQHKYLQSYQQQQQQNYFYNQQQQQQQSPTYNNNRTYVNPLLALGPMGAIGQPAQYHATTLPSPQTQQQHLKFQQYHQIAPQHKSPQQQQQQQQQTWSPVVGGSVSSSSIRQQQNDTILRLPRGPDGSTGFQMRR